MEIPINYFAVIAAAVANMALGFLWFGPVFGKQWLALSGRTPASVEAATQKGMARTYSIQILGALLMSYVLAHGLIFGSAYLNDYTLPGGLMGALWFWLGFVAPVSVGDVLWNGRSWPYWFITSGYYLVAMLSMAVILTLWR